MFQRQIVIFFIFLWLGCFPILAQNDRISELEMLKMDTVSTMRERLDSLANILHRMNADFFQTHKTVTVALKKAPPFILKHEGIYSGVSIDLWERIAKELKIDFVYKEYPDVPSITDAIRQGDVDICISPITVTGDRIKDFEFSQPFYIADLVLAVRNEQSNDFDVLKQILQNATQPLMLLIGTMFFFGLLIWLVERGKNPDFGKGKNGFIDGVWWSAVTMTTVGYGDKAPKTMAGKLISLFWMFAAVFIISSFTAKMSSAMTVDAIENELNYLQNLGQQKLASVKGSSSEDFMTHYHYRYVAYPTPLDALKALQQEEVEGFVYDEPILNYLIRTHGLRSQLKIVPRPLSKEYYSFSVPKRNAGLLKVVNPLLIEIIDDVSWKAELYRYDLK